MGNAPQHPRRRDSDRPDYYPPEYRAILEELAKLPVAVPSALQDDDVCGFLRRGRGNHRAFSSDDNTPFCVKCDWLERQMGKRRRYKDEAITVKRARAEKYTCAKCKSALISLNEEEIEHYYCERFVDWISHFSFVDIKGAWLGKELARPMVRYFARLLGPLREEKPDSERDWARRKLESLPPREEI